MSQPSFIDADLLRRLQALELKAREVAEGVLMGIHHAPHRGRSIEFAEHKEYSPGDDLRRIDWKVYARFEKLYIKEFEDETNITALLLLDCSRSMAYMPPGAARAETPPKLEMARVMAAALAYLLLNQSDAAGLAFFRGELTDFLPPRARKAHFHEITARLARVEPTADTNLAAALSALPGRIKGRALIILFSDLLDDPERMLSALRLLRHRRHEIVIFHVLEPTEIEFPFERLTLFRDLESPLKLLVDPRSLRASYHEHFTRFLEEVKKECRGHGIDYTLARTDQSPVSLLTSWLSFRAAARPWRAP